MEEELRLKPSLLNDGNWCYCAEPKAGKNQPGEADEEEGRQAEGVPKERTFRGC